VVNASKTQQPSTASDVGVPPATPVKCVKLPSSSLVRFVTLAMSRRASINALSLSLSLHSS
jgi:hypothetical protein